MMFAARPKHRRSNNTNKIVSPEEERDRMVAAGGTSRELDPRADDPRGIPMLVSATPIPLVATPMDSCHDERVGGTSCKSRESSLSMAAVSDRDFDEVLVPSAVAAGLKVKDLRKTSGCFVQVQRPVELAAGAVETEVYLVGNELQIAAARQTIARLVEASAPAVPGGVCTGAAVLLAQPMDAADASLQQLFTGPFRPHEATLSELARVSGEKEEALLRLGSKQLRALMSEHGVKRTQHKIILREVAARNDPRNQAKAGGKAKVYQATTLTDAERDGGLLPSQYEASREEMYANGVPRRRAAGYTHMPGPGETWRGRRPGTPEKPEDERFRDEKAAREWAAKQSNAGESGFVAACCVIS